MSLDYDPTDTFFSSSLVYVYCPYDQCKLAQVAPLHSARSGRFHPNTKTPSFAHTRIA